MDKFPKFEKLHGKCNFHSWKTMAHAYMDLNKLFKIASGEETNPEQAEQPKDETKLKEYKEVCEDWRYRHSLARAFILFNVDSESVSQITCYSDAAGMWKALNDIFDKKCEYTLHALVKSIVGAKCGSVKDISMHIAKYNELWARLMERTSGSLNKDSLEADLRPLAISTKAKGSFFLTTLPTEIDNIVDNLKTKDNLTYDDICARLLELSIVNNVPEDNTALYGKEKRNYSQQNRNLECSYCKENKRWFKGHTIQNCRNKKRDTRENANISQVDQEECAFPAFIEECALPVFMEKNVNKWIFDTGATSHMSGDKNAFRNLKTYNGKIRLGNDDVMNVTHIGEVTLNALLPSKQSYKVTLHDVLYVPDLKCSLMSWKKLTEKGIKMQGDMKEIVFTKNNKVVGWVLPYEKLQIFQEVKESEYATEENVHVSVVEWHRRLGHAPVSSFNEIEKSVAENQILPKERPLIDCEACIKSKMTRTICRDEGNACKKKLEKVHSDVAGPFSTQSIGGSYYYVTFIDEYSRYTEVAFIRHKNEVDGHIREYVLRMERQTGIKIGTFKSDNGGEYVSNNLKTFFTSLGIKLEYSIPNVHETNGMAERPNRTITTMARTALIDSGLPYSLWAEAIAHSVYTKNRLPHSFHKKTPYEMFFEKKPEISHLRYFGQKAFIHINKEVQPSGSKLLARSQESFMVGYGDKNGWYRFYCQNRRVVISRDYRFVREAAIFIDPIFQKQVGIKSKIKDEFKEEKENQKHKNQNESDKTETVELDIPEEEVRNENNETNTDIQITNEENLKRSDRSRKPPQRYYDEYLTLCLSSDEPKSYKEAMSCEDSEKWILAVEDELKSMEKNKVWEIVKEPSNYRAVGCKWIFKKKMSETGEVVRYKARLVAQGFTQIPGIDFEETFSPVVRYETLRMLLAHCINTNMIARQMDIKTAFLNGDLDFDIYMKIPEGIDAEPGRVCCLKKSIYGLKQSPRQWNHKLVSVLKEINLKQSEADPCMFTSQDKRKIVAVYVDDLLVLGETERDVQQVEDILSTNFEATFLGRPKYLLSLQISWNSTSVCLSQERYLEKILQKYQMINCKICHVPMNPGVQVIKAKEDDKKADKELYQSKIGSLLFLAMGTRPDIAYAINKLSQFQTDPTELHMKMVQQVFRYLKGSVSKRLIYKSTVKPEILVYSDASYGDCLDTRKSSSGYIGFYGEATVTWSSKKQQSVAVSTTESEYMALSLACRQCIWMKKLIFEITNKVSKPLLLCDNQAAIHLGINHVLHQRSKHIDIHYHYVRERIMENEAEVQYVTTKENVADILTKPLPKEIFHFHWSKISLNEGEY